MTLLNSYKFILFLLCLAFCSCNQSKTAKAKTNEVMQVDAAEFEQLMLSPNTVVLDVRSSSEIADGKIDGAIEIDYQSADFKDQVAALDKSKKYLVYCRSGGRSSKSCDVMKDEGFPLLVNLKGGYKGWSAYITTVK